LTTNGRITGIDFTKITFVTIKKGVYTTRRARRIFYDIMAFISRGDPRTVIIIKSTSA
jgi:hypothetical protein